MTIVVSDASPLNYLIWIGCDFVLPELYGRVLIPDVVIQELQHSSAPESVRAWVRRPPTWAEIRPVGLSSPPDLNRLDPGERAAIQLATDEEASLLLMDERAGVKVARERGLMVTGTLGVILQASQSGLIEIDRVLADLQRTAFRCSPDLIAGIRRRAARL
jgi:predicted nucleic acid-binding protein